MSTELVINYYLNGRRMQHTIPAGITVLDMLHSIHHICGTKKGCKEGDCGACTVSVGEWTQGRFVYQAIASCIYPAAKLHGCHLITIEGLAEVNSLHIIQEKIIDHHGAQCGYCSPGIVMSLFSLFAMKAFPDKQEISLALDGNICRCTGYEGIRNAAQAVLNSLKGTPDNWESEVLPAYAREVAQALKEHDAPIQVMVREQAGKKVSPIPIGSYHVPENLAELFAMCQDYPNAILIAGGTDLYVGINHGRIRLDHLIDISQIQGLKEIIVTWDRIRFGACVTVSKLTSDPAVLAVCPVFEQVGQQMASAQIRNAATVAGNIANASPIGDLSVVLLALGAELELTSENATRTLPLEQFFLDYKKTALQPREIISFVTIPVQPELTVLFEKSSKRKAMDIASVNSCFAAVVQGNIVSSPRVAFGGVAPVPILAQGLGEMKLDQMKSGEMKLDEAQIMETAKQVGSQFSTISDIRGSKEFRTILVKNHMIKHLHRIERQARGENHEQ